jgi:hypothetical protein
MNFRIQEPNYELTDGYLILIIKVSVLISFSWMIGLLITYTYPCLTWTGDKYPPILILFEKYHVFSWTFTLIAMYFYSKRVLKKYFNNFITNLNFDQEKYQLTLEFLNTYTGKIKIEVFNFDEINVIYQEKSDKLYGNQRVFHFSNDSVQITTLNIDHCAWRKHPEIDSLIQKLKEFKGKSN